jgi:hypothetical protein
MKIILNEPTVVTSIESGQLENPCSLTRLYDDGSSFFVFLIKNTLNFQIESFKFKAGHIHGTNSASEEVLRHKKGPG